MTQQAIRIVRLEAENFKILKAVEITPTGDVVQITGENAAGKSSVLDAIAWALGGGNFTVAQPVRRGAAKARALLDLGDITVERTRSADGAMALRVTAKDGSRLPSPQAVLDRLVGDLTFDPLAFARMEPRAQAEMLRRLVGLDLAKFDEARARVYQERTLIGRERDRAAAQVKPNDPAWDALPDQPLSIDILTGEYARAARADSDARNARQRAERLREDIAALELSLAQARDDLTQAEYVAGQYQNTEGPMAAAAAALKGAELTNSAIRVRNANRERRADATALAEKYEVLTGHIAAIDGKKAELIASAEMPVPGLSYDEGGVALNGLPFAQASTAEQLRTSVAIGARQNAALRVMLVRDGSLLDRVSMALLGGMAHDLGLQLWIERVASGAPVGIVIEDGSVAMVVEDAPQQQQQGEPV